VCSRFPCRRLPTCRLLKQDNGFSRSDLRRNYAFYFYIHTCHRFMTSFTHTFFRPPECRFTSYRDYGSTTYSAGFWFLGLWFPVATAVYFTAGWILFSGSGWTSLRLPPAGCRIATTLPVDSGDYYTFYGLFDIVRFWFRSHRLDVRFFHTSFRR